MDLFFRFYRQDLIILSVIISLIVFALPIAYAQECNWENWNCTPTPGPTPTGTIEPTETPTIQPVIFIPPDFDVPTSIPLLTFPTAPSALSFTPIPAPSVISIEITPMPTPNYSDLSITPTPAISLSTISTTLNISYTIPLTFDLSAGSGISGTDEISGALMDYSGWLSGVVSYTNYLTGEVASIQGTETITVINAPDWYAPELPRPMASVGWTFEQLTDPTGDTPNFTLISWSSFFGYVSSLPFQFVKTLWQLVAYFGPFGLFLGWLLIMFVIVLVIHFQIFLVRFIVVIIRLVVRVVELLGEWVPTGG